MSSYQKCDECGGYVEDESDLVYCELCGRSCCCNCVGGADMDLCPSCMGADALLDEEKQSQRWEEEDDPEGWEDA